MICLVVRTGEQFLASTLAHLDCQAQAIGSFGFTALADPSSLTARALLSLLTLFIALFGIRVMLRQAMTGPDLVADALRVGIALTLASSYPAWRTLGYDFIVHGPQELFRTIGMASALPGSAGDLTMRLQNVDAGLAAFNGFGSGRLGVATGDWFQLGLARSAYLIGTVLPLALVRLASGVLLALAPLIAGLILFGATRGLFIGWLRALAFLFFGSLAINVVLAAELALLEPWLQGALVARAGEIPTLEAPIEGVTITLSFAFVQLAMLAVMARLAFHNVQSISINIREEPRNVQPPAQPILISSPDAVLDAGQSERAFRLSGAIASTLQREERLLASGALSTMQPGASPNPATGASAQHLDPLGASHRRTRTRHSRAGSQRDAKS